MITEGVDDQDYTPSQIRKIGDMSILYGIMSSKVFHGLVFKSKEAFWAIIRHTMGYHLGVLAYCLTGVMRFRFGIQNCGLVLTLSAFSLLTIFNSSDVWPVFKPFGIVAMPVLVMLWDREEIKQHLWVEVHSEALQIYTIALAVTSLIHVVVSYTSYSNSKLAKRGESWIFVLLVLTFPRSRAVRKSEFVICAFLEPSVAIAWKIRCN